jgi:hypothetical protein
VKKALHRHRLGSTHLPPFKHSGEQIAEIKKQKHKKLVFIQIKKVFFDLETFPITLKGQCPD